MPHILFEKKELNPIPFTFNNIEYNFIAESYDPNFPTKKLEYKICVNDNNVNKKFLLTLKEKDKNYFLLKADKITRVTPVEIIKNAINNFTKANNLNVLFSNTSNLKEKQIIKHKYLKDIEYFVKDFETEKEINIEIGFGSGRHLLYQAKSNPDIQFIGLEIHTPSIEQLLKQLYLQNIENVLIVNYDARMFMEFIKSNKARRIFVHFPVPWDKKPHRRIYSKDFINEALRILKPEGTLELRTDSRKYFDFCVELLTNLPKGNISIDINKDLPISSKYEDRWRKQGKNIYDVVLKSFNIDKEINLDFPFEFNFKITTSNLLDSLSKEQIIKKDFFVHVQDVFIENNNNHTLIKVTFGNFNKPVSKFLILENNTLSYFQGKPIPTSSNINAHKLLNEILENDNSQ